MCFWLKFGSASDKCVIFYDPLGCAFFHDAREIDVTGSVLNLGLGSSTVKKADLFLDPALCVCLLLLLLLLRVKLLNQLREHI